MRESFGHAERLNREASRGPGAVCLVAHPLLDEVHCQRLRGHPGPHGTAVGASSVELVMEWPQQSEQAG